MLLIKSHEKNIFRYAILWTILHFHKNARVAALRQMGHPVHCISTRVVFDDVSRRFCRSKSFNTTSILFAADVREDI